MSPSKLDQFTDSETAYSGWNWLYKVDGAACPDPARHYCLYKKDNLSGWNGGKAVSPIEDYKS
ncbi:MAG: hypothetical protein O8C66_13535 [Candidatus Methanoperedens sp.]|nr:hypothetical protein [Candidatus Methanoperedens sp.]MCZ7371520.1 hypothetical protein [Candidatus Methanoperedens sp.]